MMTDNPRQQVFREMLAREAGEGAEAPAVASAAYRLFEHFAQQLTPLVGDAGVAAIYARSLHLAERQVPGLVAVQASDSDDGPFMRARRLLEQQDLVVATDAAVVLIDTICELLASFIGESLTIKLLRAAWPHDFAGDSSEEITG